MSVYPGVIVDWCVTARVKGKGKPHRHMTSGDALTATNAMAAWLESLTDLGDEPVVDVRAELISEQRPGWVHCMPSYINGMPAEEAIEYTVDWLKAVAKVKNWGSGP